MPKIKRELPPLGKEFGKSDLDRIGKDEFLVDERRLSVSYRYLRILLFTKDIFTNHACRLSTNTKEFLLSFAKVSRKGVK